jgi:PKHD-type hydroxylase
MSIYGFHIKENDVQFGPIFWENGLSTNQCDLILDTYKNTPGEMGGIVRSDTSDETNTSIRNVSIKQVTLEDMGWLYDKMYEYVKAANNDYFNYDLIGFYESMQLLHYGPDIGGGHYNWHRDCGPGISTRKLTVIVQLTNPINYEGCQVELDLDGPICKTRGSVTIFPSFITHRVTPLTSGYRDSLVMWVNGPPFK